MAVAFGKHGDIADSNMPESFIKRFRKKMRMIPVFLAGLANTSHSVFGGAGLASSFTMFGTGVVVSRAGGFGVGQAGDSYIVFGAGGAA